MPLRGPRSNVSCEVSVMEVCRMDLSAEALYGGQTHHRFRGEGIVGDKNNVLEVYSKQSVPRLQSG